MYIKLFSSLIAHKAPYKLATSENSNRVLNLPLSWLAKKETAKLSEPFLHSVV
jgi:hypothetical protein